MSVKIHFIGNAHIDPVWQWRWQDGFSEIQATFRSVLDRMNEFPKMKFTCACASYYEWIEESDPKMFAEIQKRVEEGRWCIVGGWYLQPDCNMPSGESFARHALISQRYFQEKFGRKAMSGYNVDSFGHNGALPQILRQSGMDFYVFMRPMKHEKELESDLFVWKGIDGSEVTAYRIPNEYCLMDMDYIKNVSSELLAKGGEWMAFYGVGNHGGGPTIQLLEGMEKEFGTDDRFAFSTVDEYFARVEKDALPVLQDELQHHARGCYSVVSALKQQNRNAEHNLFVAEVLSVLSETLAKTPYPKDKLNDAWKNTLFNQFHDVLCGCVIERAVEDASYIYGETMRITDRVIQLAMQRIAWRIDTLKGNTVEVFRDDRFFPFTHEKLGSPVVIFNPLPFSVCAPVTIYPKCVRVEDEDGNTVPFQLVRGWQTDGVENRYNTVIRTKIPAFGYKVVRIFRTGENVVKRNPFVYGEDFIENDCVRVRFDKTTGGVASFYDKKRGVELLSASTSGVWFDDTENDTWAHNVDAFDKKVAEYAEAEMQVVEVGETLVTMRVTSRIGAFTLRQDYTLYENDTVLYVTGKTNGCEKHRILKIKVPVNVESARAVSAIPYGAIARGTDGGEEPCGKWFAVTDGESRTGLAVLNDGKYGYSVDNNTAYLTVLRTAVYCDHYGKRDEFCENIDIAPHAFRYAISPFKDYAQAEREALVLNTPLRAVLDTFHDGDLPTEYTGISVSAENIVVSALKKAEDGRGYILRAYEASGKETETKISLPFTETEIFVKFTPFAIKTFRIDGDLVTETNMIEEN